jgi:iron complex outermembrane receptor protein
LNERFWQPGGNPNLLPEDGWGGEVGTKYTSEIWHIKWEYQATFFTRNNFNQVVWLMGNGFPQPVNMKHILTSGTEQSIKLEYPIHHKWKIASNHEINTTEAINKRKVSPNDASENKYLIYTPRISQQHQVAIKYADHSLSYQHAYNGMRYTTSDNTDWLDNYAIGNIFLLIGYPIRQVKTTFQFGINNIWNTNYVVVADRPMPGRNYQLTLTFKI